MFKYGKKSQRVLDSLNEDLAEILTEAIKWVDISLVEGKRSPERQAELLKFCKTKTIKSKNIDGKAIDFAHYHNGIQWDHRENFIYAGGIIKGIACMMGIKVIYGGDWDSDNNLYDNSFDDLCHIELV